MENNSWKLILKCHHVIQGECLISNTDYNAMFKTLSLVGKDCFPRKGIRFYILLICNYKSQLNSNSVEVAFS